MHTQSLHVGYVDLLFYNIMLYSFFSLFYISKLARLAKAHM